MDTNAVDIQVVSLEETDGLIIEEIDITINEAGNCNCIFLRYICILINAVIDYLKCT